MGMGPGGGMPPSLKLDPASLPPCYNPSQIDWSQFGMGSGM